MPQHNVINPTAAEWLMEWHENAILARKCVRMRSHRSARLHAQHARTCLQNFMATYKRPINGQHLNLEG